MDTRRLFSAVAACGVGRLAADGAGAQVDDAENIRTIVEELLFMGKLDIDGATITTPALPELYTRRNLAPAWTPARSC